MGETLIEHVRNIWRVLQYWSKFLEDTMYIYMQHFEMLTKNESFFALRINIITLCIL